MTTHDDFPQEESISLMDVYLFLSKNRKIICLCGIAGLLLGLLTALLLPVKYQASAAIETSRVQGKDIEPVSVLAERMHSPTYYSDKTLHTCYPDAQDDDLAETLVKKLGLKIDRQSSFVSLSFQAKSTATAHECLNAVLADVTFNQGLLAAPQIEKSQHSLALAKEKLSSAKEFVSSFSGHKPSFDFKDPQFSASSLLVSTVISRQNEIKGLEEQIDSLSKDLAPPQTKLASFATPIYTPKGKVWPPRSLICFIGTLLGVAIGIGIGFYRLNIKTAQRMTSALHTASVERAN